MKEIIIKFRLIFLLSLTLFSSLNLSAQLADEFEQLSLPLQINLKHFLEKSTHDELYLSYLQITDKEWEITKSILSNRGILSKVESLYIGDNRLTHFDTEGFSDKLVGIYMRHTYLQDKPSPGNQLREISGDLLSRIDILTLQCCEITIFRGDTLPIMGSLNLYTYIKSWKHSTIDFVLPDGRIEKVTKTLFKQYVYMVKKLRILLKDPITNAEDDLSLKRLINNIFEAQGDNFSVQAFVDTVEGNDFSSYTYQDLKPSVVTKLMNAIGALTPTPESMLGAVVGAMGHGTARLNGTLMGEVPSEAILLGNSTTPLSETLSSSYIPSIAFYTGVTSAAIAGGVLCIYLGNLGLNMYHDYIQGQVPDNTGPPEVDEEMGEVRVPAAAAAGPITPLPSTAPDMSALQGAESSAIPAVSAAQTTAEPPVLEDSSDKCCICQVNAKDYAFTPCGHKAFCGECSQQIFDSSTKICPICRGPIESRLRIYDI